MIGDAPAAGGAGRGGGGGGGGGGSVTTTHVGGGGGRCSGSDEAGCALKQIFQSSALPHVPAQAPEESTPAVRETAITNLRMI